jgi:hypothetical protein
MQVETKARNKQFRKQKHGTQKELFFKPMMLKQHLCTNQLKVPNVCELDCSKIQKITQSAKCKHKKIICDLQSTY